MRFHPDREFADLITAGVWEGFRIGFDYGRVERSQSTSRNMASAYEHPTVVSDYLAEECRKGRVLGPFKHPPVPCLLVSRFGVIQKRGQPNKWRLIMDLSYPEVSSVNDAISGEDCSLSYVSVDQIAACVLALGRGSLLAKSDVKQAYRQVPVHPQDHILLGMSWKGHYYVDALLPFGLRSAPLIFSALADALEWVVRQAGVKYIFHYIDDFIIVGPPGDSQCEEGLRALQQTAHNLGVVLAEDKTEGPATQLTILGIEVDSVAMTLCLPVEKLQRLRTLLAEWQGRKSGLRRELESLVGQLQHASKVVRAGRCFMRRQYDLLANTHHFQKHFRVRLNAECQADVEWWVPFCMHWNSVSILRQCQAPQADIHLHSDASGSWVCGAHWKGLWFQVAWDRLPIADATIAPKELFPILVVCVCCGVICGGGQRCVPTATTLPWWR